MMQLTGTFFVETTLGTHFAFACFTCVLHISLLTDKLCWTNIMHFSSAGIIAVSKSLQRFSRIPNRTAVSLNMPTTSSAFVILCLDGKLFTLNSQGSQLVSYKISASWQGLFGFCNPSFSSSKSLFDTSFDEMKSLLPSRTGRFLPFLSFS